MIPQHPLPPNGLVGKQISVSDRILTRVVTGTHRRLLRRTGGRLMNSMGGNRVRILTVVGRKTGRPRRHPVITVADGADVLIVATNGGAADHPLWLRNIAANPNVRLDYDGTDIPMRATVLPTEEKDAIWPTLVGAYHGYATMQHKTDRDIPVIRLTAV